MTPQRKTPLKRGTKPIARRKRLASSKRPIRNKGKRKCYAHLRDEPYKDWARETFPCEVSGEPIAPGVLHRCSGILEFAHVVAEGIGGADRGNGVILCTEAHTSAPWSLHRDGRKSFEKRFGLDLASVAARLATQYESFK